MEDLTQYLPHLLVVAGFSLQWAMRQFKAVKEWQYHVVAVLLCVSAHLLVHSVPTTNAGFIKLLIWLPAAVPTVWGGTFAASSYAKSRVASGNTADSHATPLTNSK